MQVGNVVYCFSEKQLNVYFCHHMYKPSSFLKAAIIIQDSCFEVQKHLLLEGESLPTSPISDYDFRKVSVDVPISSFTNNLLNNLLC